METVKQGALFAIGFTPLFWLMNLVLNLIVNQMASEENKKENFLKKFEQSTVGKRLAKLTATASPAIAAAIAFPSETYMFLKTAKEVGFEIPMPFFLGAIAWWFRKDAVKLVDTRVAGATESLVASAEANTKVGIAVELLSNEVKESTATSQKQARISEERWSFVNKRFLENDNKQLELTNEVKKIGEKVLTIETHLAGGVPPATSSEIQELAQKVAAEAALQNPPKDPDLTP